MQNGPFLETRRRRHNDGGGKKISSLIFVLEKKLVKYTFSSCASLEIGNCSSIHQLLRLIGHWFSSGDASPRSKLKTETFSRTRPLSRGRACHSHLHVGHRLECQTSTCVSFTSSRGQWKIRAHGLAIESLGWVSIPRVILERSLRACARTCNRTTSLTLASISELVNKHERG